MARPIYMKTFLITTLIILSSLWIVTSPITTTGLTVSGSITGTPTTWSGTVEVIGDIYIESGANLTINAGTQVIMRGNYGIYVGPNADLFVNGAVGNMVRINSTEPGGWWGIYLNTTTSSAVINYAVINNSLDGINANYGGSLRMTGCIMWKNTFGVQGTDIDPIIKDSLFHNNSFPLLFISVNGTVYNSEFRNNTNALMWFDSKGGPSFDESLVVGGGETNGANGVEFTDTNIHFTNNTIKYNAGSGVTFSHCSAYVYKNDILMNGRVWRNPGVRIFAQSYPDTTILENNNVIGNGRGIFLDRNTIQSQSNISVTVKDNTINSNIQTGLEIKNYSYPLVNNNIIKYNNIGVSVYKAAPVVANSTITNNAMTDWYVWGYGVPTSLNSEFNTVNVTVNRTNQFLKVKWYLHATVLENVTNNPINNAEITVVSDNKTGTTLNRHFTNAQGKVEYIHILEKILRRNVVFYFANFTLRFDELSQPRVYVAKTYSNYKIPYERSITVYLDANKIPSNVTGITPLTTHDTTPCIKWKPSKDDNNDPITYEFKLGYTPGVGDVWGPETTTNNYYCARNDQELQYGIYYFSIRAGDNRYSNSSWVTVMLNISNNPPSKPVITTSPDNIYTDTNITVTMTSPSVDKAEEVNDFGETIRYSIEVYINNQQETAYSRPYINESDVNFEIDKKDFDKGDEVRIVVTPYDGHSAGWNSSGGSGAYKHSGSGYAADVIVTVLNHAPDINNTIPDINMNEDSIYLVPITFFDIFDDPDNEDLAKLKFQSVPDENFDIGYDKITHQITIIPKPNYFTPPGTKDKLIFQANDTAGGITNLTVNVVVHEINDPPIINVNDLQVAYQDKMHYINITLTDPADLHDSGKLSIGTNYTELPFGNKITLVENSKDNISLSFTPSNDDIGIFYLNISGSDTKSNVFKNLEITIINVNDRPDKPVLIAPVASNHVVNLILNTTDEIEFEATAFDPDLKWNDNLQFRWKSNVSGWTLGNKAKFSTPVIFEGHHNITITVTDSGGLTNSEFFHIFVINPLKEEFPQVELIYPKDERTIPSTSTTLMVTLTWKPLPHKYSNLFRYDVFMDKKIDTDKTKAIDLEATELPVSVNVGETYYWWVIPKIGRDDPVRGDSFSGKWSFTVELVPQIIAPEITLLTPLDEAIVNSTDVELTWTTDGESADSYSYEIFISEDPNPMADNNNRLEDYWPEMEYKVKNLKDETTYYWDVRPFFGSQAGTSDGPFEFYVNTNFEPKPEVTVTPDEFKFEMKPTDSKDFEYTIKNTGNTIESLTITITTSDEPLVESLLWDYDEIRVKLKPGETQDISFKLQLNNIGTGDYNIRLKILSDDGDLSFRKDIKINVKQDDKVINEQKSNLKTIIIALIIVIIIVMVVALLFIFRKKPKPESKEEDERISKPSARPVAGAARPQIPAPAAPKAIAGKAGVDEPAQALAKPAAAKPQLAPAPVKATAETAKPELPITAKGEGTEPKPALPSAEPKAGTETQVESESKPEAQPSDGEGKETGSESEAKSKCPTCNADIPAGASECPICAAKIT